MKKSEIIKRSVGLAAAGLIAGTTIPAVVNAFVVEDNLNEGGRFVSAETPQNESVLWVDSGEGNALKYNDTEKWVRLATEFDVADLKKLMMGDEAASAYSEDKENTHTDIPDYDFTRDITTATDFDSTKGYLKDVATSMSNDNLVRNRFLVRKNGGGIVNGNGDEMTVKSVTAANFPSYPGGDIPAYDPNVNYNPGDLVMRNGALNVVMGDGSLSTNLSDMMYSYYGEYGGTLSDITAFDYNDYITQNNITRTTIVDKLYYFEDQQAYGMILVTVNPSGASMQLIPAVTNPANALVKKDNGKYGTLADINTNIDTLPDLVLYRENSTVTNGEIDWGNFDVRKTNGTELLPGNNVAFQIGDKYYTVEGGKLKEASATVDNEGIVYNYENKNFYQITINPTTGEVIKTLLQPSEVPGDYYKPGDVVRKNDNKYYYLNEDGETWVLIGDTMSEYNEGDIVRKDDGKYYVFTRDEETGEYSWKEARMENSYNVGDTAWINDELKVYTFDPVTREYSWQVVPHNVGDTITKDGVLYIYSSYYNTETNQYEYKWEETSTLEMLHNETEARKDADTTINNRITNLHDAMVTSIENTRNTITNRIDAFQQETEAFEDSVRDYGALLDTHNKVDILTGKDANGKLTNKNVTQAIVIAPEDWQDVDTGTYAGYKSYTITDSRITTSDMVEINYATTYLDVFRYETTGNKLVIYTQDATIVTAPITVENIILYYNTTDSDAIG